MTPKASEPAFMGKCRNDDGIREMSAGLTKRELFAAMAMQGMCAADEYVTATPTNIARDAVACADALLSALGASDGK